ATLALDRASRRAAGLWRALSREKTSDPVEGIVLPQAVRPVQPHLDSPQFRQVMQPSIITTAAVEHLAHSCAPSGKCDFENASVCLARASNSARFSSTSFCWCSSSL